MVVMFCFTSGVLRNTAVFLWGELFLGSSASVTERLGCLTVVYLLMKMEKYKSPAFKAMCLFLGFRFLWQVGLFDLVLASHSFPLPVNDVELGLDPFRPKAKNWSLDRQHR